MSSKSIDPYNFELYRFKAGAFFETQCAWLQCSCSICCLEAGLGSSDLYWL